MNLDPPQLQINYVCKVSNLNPPRTKTLCMLASQPGWLVGWLDEPENCGEWERKTFNSEGKHNLVNVWL